jgi:hypothetical protein
VLFFEYQIAWLMYLGFHIYVYTSVFGVHEQTWDRHGVRHALLYGCAVGGVGDEVENGGGGVVVECEARVRGWQEGRDGLWWGRL